MRRWRALCPPPRGPTSVALSVVALVLLQAVGSWAGCGMGFLQCSDGSCIDDDKFCDSTPNCPKEEDEPRQCTRK